MRRFSSSYVLRAILLHLMRQVRDWLRQNVGLVLFAMLVPLVTVSAEMGKERAPAPKKVAASSESAKVEKAVSARVASGKIRVAEPVATEAPVMVVRTATRLREYPDESAEILKVLRPGTQLEVTDTTPDTRWAKVREPKEGAVGWVWASLLGSDLPEVPEVVSTKAVIESIANSRGLTEKQAVTVRKLGEHYDRVANEIKPPKLQVRPVAYGREAIPVKLYPAYPTVIRFFLDGKPAKLAGDPFFGDTSSIVVQKVDSSSITVALNKAEDTSQTGFVRLAGYPDPVWVKLVGKTVQDIDRPVSDQQVDIQISSPDAAETRNEHYLENVVSGAQDSVTAKVRVLSVEAVNGSQRDVSALRNMQAWVSINNGKLVVQAPQGWLLFDSPSRPSASGAIAATGEKFYEFNGRPDVLTFRNGPLIASVRLVL